MAKAAAELAVTQPAISRAIADMESTLGMRLLDRRPQGVTPTRYGQTLLKWGDALFEDLRRAVQEMESIADPAAGEVCVGANGGVFDGLLPIAVDRFSRRFPKVTFKVAGAAEAIGVLYEELRARKHDLVVGRMPAGYKPEEDLHVEILFTEPLVVVAGSAERFARRNLSLGDLVDEQWVLPGLNTEIGAFIARLFRHSGLDYPRHGISVSDLGFSSTMIQRNRYLGMFPGSLLRFAGHTSLEVLPVKLTLEPPPVALVTVKNRTLTSAAAKFIEVLRELAKPLARRTGTKGPFNAERG
jgi:DNA-binding transcriptional LysR family regulator